MKLIGILISLFLLVGCENDLMNTPTKRVETLMNNYITLDEEVLSDLDRTLLTETIMTTNQKDRYKNIIKRQYQHLSYEIKDETIDGDNATVEVEIEVYDYNKASNDAISYLNSNPSEFIIDGTTDTDLTKFNDYKLDRLENINDKVTYTLNLTLTKNNDKWVLDNLTDTEISKIHGLYNY